MSVSARSAALVVAITPLSRNSPNQRSVRSLTIELRSALEEVVGDRSAHLAETNEAKSHRILLTHVQNSSVPSE